MFARRYTPGGTNGIDLNAAVTLAPAAPPANYAARSATNDQPPYFVQRRAVDPSALFAQSSPHDASSLAVRRAGASGAPSGIVLGGTEAVLAPLGTGTIGGAVSPDHVRGDQQPTYPSDIIAALAPRGAIASRPQDSGTYSPLTAASTSQGSLAPAGAIGANAPTGGSTVSRSGTVTNGIFLADPTTTPNPVTVTGTFTALNGYGVLASYGATRSYVWSFYNLATVNAFQNAKNFGAESFSTLAHYFEIKSEASLNALPSYGILLKGAGTVTNSASLTASGGSGVLADEGVGTVINNGVIQETVLSGGVIRQAGIRLDYGGVIINTGVIAGLNGALMAYDVRYDAAYHSTVTNSSTITGYAAGVAGVEIFGGGGTITNMGGASITGNVGVMLGNPTTQTGMNIVTNGGTITGTGGTAVEFQSNDSLLVVQPGAVFNGIVVGGTGANSIELAMGSGAGTLDGLGSNFLNFASVTVDPGAAWTVKVATSPGGETITGAGGTDVLMIGISGTINLSGVSGFPTIALAGTGANSVVLTDANFAGLATPMIVVNGGAAGNTIDATALSPSNNVVLNGSAGSDVFMFSATSLTAADVVAGSSGSDTLTLTSAGVIAIGGVRAVETFKLASTGVNTVSLINANFTNVNLSKITVNGGAAGNTINAAALSPSNSVVLNGGAGNDVFVFSATSLTAADVVAGSSGTDILTLTSAGTIAVSGVRAVEIYTLASTGANTLALTDANFTNVNFSKITVNGGAAGNTINAAALSPSNSVVLNGGAGSDVFVFSAISLTASDVVAGLGGSDTLMLTSSGTINAGGVRAVEIYTLASTGANALTLTNANFTNVSLSTIKVNGGADGNTIDATALSPSNSVVLNGGAGSDVFIFSAASLTASDIVAGVGGSDTLMLTSSGTINAGGVRAVEIYTLASTGANALTLTNANFTNVSLSTIKVNGGADGNTIDATALSPSNSVVLNGGAGSDVFIFSAASLTASDIVAGVGGSDTLMLTSSGTINAGGVRAVEIYTLASTGANALTLTNANFTNVSLSTIKVNGGADGNTIDATALSPSNSVVLNGGAGSDVFIFSAASLTASDIVAGVGGSDTLMLTSSGTINAGGVRAVEIYTLASTGANALTLTNANFTNVSLSTIKVNGGADGNTIDATALSPSNSVVLNGGAGSDVFIFSAASLTASDIVAGVGGSDTLMLTSSGTINAGGVRAVEIYTLASTGANALTLTNANF